MKRTSITAVLLATFTLAASAQTLSGIKLEPASVKVGEPVKITGTFDNADNPNCNVRLHFGDGVCLASSAVYGNFHHPFLPGHAHPKTRSISQTPETFLTDSGIVRGTCREPN